MVVVVGEEAKEGSDGAVCGEMGNGCDGGVTMGGVATIIVGDCCCCCCSSGGCGVAASSACSSRSTLSPTAPPTDDGSPLSELFDSTCFIESPISSAVLLCGKSVFGVGRMEESSRSFWSLGENVGEIVVS